MLKGEKVTKRFAGLVAVKEVDFSVKEKEIVGLIGPNGAGKTTLFNCITGAYPPDSGSIIFKGREIAGLRPYRTCALGIGRTFQVVKPFLEMTVLDNVLVGSFAGRSGITKMSEARAEAMRILDFVGLSAKRDLLAKSLTLAERKSLELARALAVHPDLILLDEVVAGLNPTETKEAMDRVRKMRDEMGKTIFMVEHVMKAVMGVSDRIMVLHHGEKIAEGSPEEVASEKKVIEAYLGERYIL